MAKQIISILVIMVLLGCLGFIFLIYQLGTHVEENQKIIPGKSKGTEWIKLLQERAKEIDSIEFTVYGKIAEVKRIKNSEAINKIIRALLNSNQLTHPYSVPFDTKIQIHFKVNPEDKWKPDDKTLPETDIGIGCNVDDRRGLIYGEYWQSRELYTLFKGL